MPLALLHDHSPLANLFANIIDQYLLLRLGFYPLPFLVALNDETSFD
jgi:hypothetical protein